MFIYIFQSILDYINLVTNYVDTMDSLILERNYSSLQITKLNLSKLNLKLFKNMSVLILLLCIIQIFSKPVNFACRDPNNSIVDWYVIMLLPTSAHPEKKLVYMYYDEKTGPNQYEFDAKTFPPIRDTQEVDDMTPKNKVNFFFWNDDTSTEDKSSSAYPGKAHSKGALVYNKDSGYFLMHSLPRFPRRTAENKFVYELPDNAGIYAQHFLCISTDLENNLKIVDTLNIINPQLIIKNGEEDNVSENESVTKLIKNRSDPELDHFKVTVVKSIGNRNFIFFSRSKNEEKLQFDHHIPKFYEDDFYIETWTKPSLLEPICDGLYKAFNVKSLKFGNISYTNSKEHAKWSVAAKKDISCFGDLNRTKQVTVRGGNVVCIKDKKLAKLMRNAITDSEDCEVKKFLDFLF
jgi:deoxyribonuclease-2